MEDKPTNTNYNSSQENPPVSEPVRENPNPLPEQTTVGEKSMMGGVMILVILLLLVGLGFYLANKDGDRNDVTVTEENPLPPSEDDNLSDIEADINSFDVDDLETSDSEVDTTLESEL